MAGDLPMAAERGAITVADRVVTKIAARAAREAIGGVPEGGSVPDASVTVLRNSARVRIGLELPYPSDIGALCGAVRRQVTWRLGVLVGLEVPEVAVRIERLHSVNQWVGRAR